MADINDFLEPWHGHSGSEVQRFLKNEFSKLIENTDKKVGWLSYENGNIVMYDEQDGTQIGVMSLSGIIYALTLDSITPSTFYVLRDDTSAYIELTPQSKSGEIGHTLSPFTEDYVYSVLVDGGSGTFVEKASGTCESGNNIRVNVRDYLSMGTNRVKLSVSGVDSLQTRTFVYAITVASLSLNCNFDWSQPFVEGDFYAINGINFSGNMQKTLHVMLDNDQTKHHTKIFASATNYNTTEYYFNMTDKFPGTTGIHTIDIWMTAEGVETQHFVYNIMCIATEDIGNVALMCFNNVISSAKNYETQTLFKYAVYGTNSVVFNISASDGETVYDIAVNEQMAAQSQARIDYITRLEFDNAGDSVFEMNVSATVGEETYEITIPVDSTSAYAATEGYNTYFTPAIRNNFSLDRENFINSARNAEVAAYQAIWDGFSWEKDGWYRDADNNKCLCINAGSSISIPDYQPLAEAETESVSFEFMYRVANVANYDEPILSIMSTAEYDPATTSGIILFPTKLVVLASTNREVTPQSYNMAEDSILHVVVVLQRGYKRTGRNLCRIYVNGIPQITFEYSGIAAFGNGGLKLGQSSADSYFYLFRSYLRALEDFDVLSNFLNAVIETRDFCRDGIKNDNDILDSGDIDYELCKRAGFNTMVIEMQGSAYLPDLDHNQGGISNLTLEYADYPSWNVKITNAPIDGQGTTSMRYYRWNLRWKLANNSQFTYANGTTDTKKGYIAGIGLHPKCQRITAKKNVASSMQGHKMGSCNMYDELYEACGLKSALPSTLDRVAVYQHPMMGFQKFQDGTYKFIGLYTVGPDKGDKGTFGYDTDAYPSLLSLEGPNHLPLGTRFLHPWTNETQYDGSQETLTFGGEEGWDVDVCAYDTEEDEEQIQALLTAEWKPAYDIVYYCSPFICSLAETGMTLAQINANLDSFRSASNILGTRRNEVLQLYDSSYNLIYYRNTSRQYEVLTGHNIVTYLADYLSGNANPTTAEIISARKAKFAAEAHNYWSINDACYHEAFCELVGATDNHAKNTYPFKFNTLANGGRWGWREDDLDTVIATDNNGQSTKHYGIEVGDTSNGVDIFQGSSSVFWTLINDVFAPQVRAMMSNILNALSSLALGYNISGANLHESVYNMFEYYYWRHSAKYFPIMGYAKDAMYSYIDVWESAPDSVYNQVPPLRQALGTQLEAEKVWVERRIAYICSQYELGGFAGSSDDGYGKLEFTPSETFTFELTPAVDMYPSGNKGGGINIKGERTLAGQTCELVASSEGTTTFYLKGVDLLTSLGDLSGLALTTRGADATVGATMTINGKRLRSIKVGDEIAENVDFNAATLNISGNCIESVDARNVTSLRNPVSLLNCPRLKEAYFEGSSAPNVQLPIGSKVTDVSFPSQLTTLFLHSLPLLQEENMLIPATSFYTITGFYFNNCPGIDPFALLRQILGTQNNVLRYITIISSEEIAGTAMDVELLASLAEGYGRIIYDAENNVISNSNDLPNLQLTLNIDGNVYEDSVETIRNTFPGLTITASGYYIRFEDAEVARICAINWGDYIETVTTEVVTDGSDVVEQTIVTTPVSMLNTTPTRGTSVTTYDTRAKVEGDTAGTTSVTTKTPVGMTTTQAAAVSSIGTNFRQNATISKFNEFRLFTNVKSIHNECFYNCSNLSEIEIPESLTALGGYSLTGPFGNCALKKINLKNVTHAINGTFNGCTQLVNVDAYKFKYGNGVFQSTGIKRLILPNAIGGNAADKGHFGGLVRQCYNCMVDIGPNLAYIGGLYCYMGSVTTIIRSKNFTLLAKNAFQSATRIYCTSEMYDYLKDTNYNSYTNVVYLIGGEQWVAQYGSVDPYANLTAEEKAYYYPDVE